MKKLLTFLAVLAIGNTAMAQIPNAGFESWDSLANYKSPISWDNLDSLTNTLSVYTCEQGTPGNVGAHYLKLTSKTAGPFVAPGIAVSGKIDFTSYTAKSGFAFTSRPASLTGKWQYMASGADQGYIQVFLSKWNVAMNMRDTIAFKNYPLSGMVMSWGSFTIPLTYYHGGTPDTAIIVLSASGATPVAGSYLYVDTLNFTGSVPNGVQNVTSTSSQISISPNPAHGLTTVRYTGTADDAIDLYVSDINGRIVATLHAQTKLGDNAFSIDASKYAKGTYFVKMISESGAQVKKFIVE